MQRVFILDKQKQPLMPCYPARVRELLTKGKAAVYRRAPFTIILRDRTGGDTHPVELKADPGSKTSGIALVATFQRGVSGDLGGQHHPSGHAIKSVLDSRRALRRGRRSRKTHYRAPSFLNRTRPAGWLPPSQQSRVENVRTLALRLQRARPLTAVARAPKTLGLPTAFWPDGHTRKNRSDQGYAKHHWIDVVCVGESGKAAITPSSLNALSVTAKGRGSRQMCRMNRYGFPNQRGR